VILVGRDLNTLVNSDIVTSLCPPPDPKVFPQGLESDWIKPGRAVWRYLDNDARGEPAPRQSGAEERRASTTSTTRRVRAPVTPAVAEAFSHEAGQLGFEYNVLEGYWRRWSDEQLREVVDDAKQRHVALFVWVHSKELHDPAARRKLFDQLRELGVAGVKIDFFDHEHKEVIDLYESIRRDAAQDHLLLDFHGANKPTGEQRTWPNELNREAVHGMEASRLMDSATHDTTLPFTRFLAGPADYTPVLFTDRRRNTTIAHQIATAAVFTEPLLTYASNPRKLLDSPAVEMIKSIPATWDQTIVLPVSEIGQCAAFARRSGDTWFLAIINGNSVRKMQLPLKFLGPGEHRALVVRDDDDDPSGLKVERTTFGGGGVSVQLRPGGGYIARVFR
jgi:alpha-glucosidase